jgi:hypothetical protein
MPGAWRWRRKVADGAFDLALGVVLAARDELFCGKPSAWGGRVDAFAAVAFVLRIMGD